MNFYSYRCASRRFILILIAGSALTLWSMTTTTETMATENQSAPERSYSIPAGVNVRGATAGITTEYFEQVMADAITSSGIFTGIDNSSSTPYLLDIRIIKVSAPSFSRGMTVSMNVVWELYRTADNARLLHENIFSTYTGGAFEGGLIGANRVRVAMEGAARENIRIGIGMLATLSLEQNNNQVEERETGATRSVGHPSDEPGFIPSLSFPPQLY